MRTLLLVVCLALLPAAASAQSFTPGLKATRIASGTRRPTTCRTGDVFLRTGSSPQFYLCDSPDTWTAVGGAGGSPGGSDTQVQFNDGNTFGGAANLLYRPVGAAALDDPPAPTAGALLFSGNLTAGNLSDVVTPQTVFYLAHDHSATPVSFAVDGIHTDVRYTSSGSNAHEQVIGHSLNVQLEGSRTLTDGRGLDVWLNGFSDAQIAATAAVSVNQDIEGTGAIPKASGIELTNLGAAHVDKAYGIRINDWTSADASEAYAIYYDGPLAKNFSVDANGAVDAPVYHGNGGTEVDITAGGSTGASNAYAVAITGGDAGGSGAGGDVTLASGGSDSGTAGNINLTPAGGGYTVITGAVKTSNTGYLTVPDSNGATWNLKAYNTTSHTDTTLLTLTSANPPTLVFDSQVRSAPVAAASLDTCNAGNEGALRAVNNATSSTWGATVTGVGSNHVLAYCNGTNWTVAAK